MKITDLLDRIEQLEPTAPDRYILLSWMSDAIRELTGIVDSDLFYRYLDPAVTTIANIRSYLLPADFPENFVRHAGQRSYRALAQGGDKWCCKIDDGTNESLLDYETPVILRSRNLRGESSGRPTVYTVESTPSGTRQIVLSPPPDDEYYINGLYLPEWSLVDMNSLPPIQHPHIDILKYAVLKLINPQRWSNEYDRSLNALQLSAARNRVAQLVPALGRGSANEYAAARRRF